MAAHNVKQFVSYKRKTLFAKAVRTLCALLLLLGICGIRPQPVFAQTVTPDNLGYPWPTDNEAPCKFGNDPVNNPSCQNPNNAADKYDWGVYNSSNVFEQYRNGAYEYRNCTDYVAWKIQSLGGTVSGSLQDGGQWYNNSPASARRSIAQPGYAAVKAGTPGHVAFVEKVNSVDNNNHGNDNITISEYNYGGVGRGDYRTGTVSEMGFTGFVDFGVTPTSNVSTIAKPAAISFNNALNVFIRGGDGQIYGQYWNGTSWSGYTSIGGGMAGDPALIVNNGALSVFARGNDGQIYTKYNAGSGWNGWASLGSTTMRGNPSVVQYGSEVDVFALGMDGHPYKDTWQPTTGWGGWTSLGNYMDSSPAAVVYGSNLVVVMRGGDNAIYADTWNGTSWTGFGAIGGGGLVGNPAVVAYGGQLSVLANATNNHLYMNTWNGTSWGGWADHGGIFYGNPAMMQYNNDLEFFARDSSVNIWTRWWSASGQTWGGWNSLGGGVIAGDPTAIQYSTELDVFAVGNNGRTYKNTFNPVSGWGGFTALPL